MCHPAGVWPGTIFANPRFFSQETKVLLGKQGVSVVPGQAWCAGRAQGQAGALFLQGTGPAREGYSQTSLHTTGACVARL